MKILNSNRATMPKCFLLFVLLFSFCVGFAQPTLSLDWMKTEPDGRANLVKKDSQGNIVVLANSGGSVYNYITTIKYDKNGNQLWKRIYTDTLNEYPDLGSAIELDSLDNIYVGGTVNFDGSGSS